MPYHTSDCWCETCRRFRARIEALEAELAERKAQLEAVFWSHQERVDGLNADRDEARSLVIRALAPDDRDSWQQWMAEAEALPWVRAAVEEARR